MTDSVGSYDIRNFAIDPDDEINRLNSQVDLFWNQELPVYQSAGLRDGMTVLDCGCGPGFLLEKMCGMYPNIQCIGIDVAKLMVRVALENATMKGLRRCRFDTGSILELPYPDCSYDFAICRLVVEHLRDPKKALSELFRILKPGGAIVVIANDFDLHEMTWPDCPALSQLYDAYRRARRSDGGNPCVGRELPNLMLLSGFRDVELRAICAHSRSVGDELFLKAEGSGISAQLVKNGFLSSETFYRVSKEWKTMLSTPGHSMVRVLFAGIGKKPPI